MPHVQANYARNLRHAAAVLDRLKLAAGCADCGFSAWPEALHFDHVDPQTKRRELGWFDDRSKLTSRARLGAFLDHVHRYCEIRCANCHAHRTITEQQWRVRRDQAERPARDDATLF